MQVPPPAPAYRRAFHGRSWFRRHLDANHRSERALSGTKAITEGPSAWRTEARKAASANRVGSDSQREGIMFASPTVRFLRERPVNPVLDVKPCAEPAPQ